VDQQTLLRLQLKGIFFIIMKTLFYFKNLKDQQNKRNKKAKEKKEGP